MPRLSGAPVVALLLSFAAGAVAAAEETYVTDPVHPAHDLFDATRGIHQVDGKDNARSRSEERQHRREH